MKAKRWRWIAAGDLNAFCGLAVDNMSNLVILAGLLIGAFQFPPDLVLYRMIPGTAVGVLVGDLIYSWMALRLARRSGRGEAGRSLTASDRCGRILSTPRCLPIRRPSPPGAAVSRSSGGPPCGARSVLAL